MDARFVDIEPPVRRSRSPLKSSWTELKFARIQIEPVGVFIDEISREIAREFEVWYEL